MTSGLCIFYGFFCNFTMLAFLGLKVESAFCLGLKLYAYAYINTIDYNVSLIDMNEETMH